MFQQQQQDPDSQRNLMLALFLSMAILVGWHFFYSAPRLKEEAERRKLQPITQSSTTATQGVPVVGGPAAVATPALAPITRAQAIAASPRHPIVTPSLTGSIALKGARIDDLVLAAYHEKVSKSSPNITLLSPGGAPDAYFADFLWIPSPGVTTDVPGRDTVWTAQSAAPLAPGQPLTLTWTSPQNLTFTRTISIDDKYMFEVTDTVENKSTAPVTLSPFARLFRLGTPKVEGWAILHEGLLSVAKSNGSSSLNEVTYAELAKEAEAADKARKPAEGIRAYNQLNQGWVGITDKYWATALIPNQAAKHDSRLVGFKKTLQQEEGHQADVLNAPLTIAPGAAASNIVHLFAGAKEVKVIDAYKTKLGNIEKFEKLVDWGYFFYITEPLYWLIYKLHSWLGNFGLAILATTVLVKAAFLPLANKSYESMAKMKKLQPEMERIRTLHKDDPMKQRTEMMELYKREKINPAAGCLPILLQIPVFFALYKVLFVTLDMRHAPFFGWIKDLSAADPTSIFNLFGLLPFAVPEFLQIGVWPIIMGITMWVQMQLNPQQPDPIQQKIFNWMPVMFTFMLGTFPAGLVIYWAWSNILSIMQQYWIMKKHGAEIHLWKNIGTDRLSTISDAIKNLFSKK